MTTVRAACDTEQPHKDGARWASRSTRAVIGSVAGLGATVVMSTAMWGFRLIGLMQHRAPPVEIVNRARRLTGDRGARRTSTRRQQPHISRSVQEQALSTAHSHPGGPRLASGIAWGLAVWATSYLHVLPALRLMPKPGRDESGRQVGIAVSHVVYGASLGVLAGVLQRHRDV